MKTMNIIQGYSSVFDDEMDTSLKIEQYNLMPGSRDGGIILTISDDQDQIVIDKSKIKALIRLLVEYQLEMDNI